MAEFAGLLTARKLKLVVDVRTIPKSRHNPQFGMARLKRSLQARGIQYVHMAELGGLRHARKDSPNMGWHNSSFRGYADYMQTPDFQRGLKRLIALSKRKRLAIMCAEAVPWRCHRSLIADALTAKGIPVLDIFTETNSRAHKMTSFARIGRGKRLTYPAPAA
jgi:uncharacterized protein (DUF488 family)